MLRGRRLRWPLDSVSRGPVSRGGLAAGQGDVAGAQRSDVSEDKRTNEQAQVLPGVEVQCLDEGVTH